MTRTYVTMQVSEGAHAEVLAQLKAAGYDHAIHGVVLDMHGIALVPGEDTRLTLAEVLYLKQCVEAGAPGEINADFRARMHAAINRNAGFRARMHAAMSAEPELLRG